MYLSIKFNTKIHLPAKIYLLKYYFLVCEKLKPIGLKYYSIKFREQSTLPKINSDKLAQSILQIAINESSSGPKKQLPYTLEGLKTQILALNEEELVMLL